MNNEHRFPLYARFIYDDKDFNGIIYRFDSETSGEVVYDPTGDGSGRVVGYQSNSLISCFNSERWEILPDYTEEDTINIYELFGMEKI